MRSISHIANHHDAWAVLLAGGDGTRLQSLTRKITGDSRPKQFCRILGDKSLLRQTQERIDPLFPSDRIMFVVTRAHEEFYREDLSNSDQSRIIDQAHNRGTGVAIVTALLRITEREADPLVAFFPCDHYYSDDSAFIRAVSSALEAAAKHPQLIVLLGAEAQYPEIEYGWIEPGSPVGSSSAIPLLRVNRFWEKPTLPKARTLLDGSCLWNTFVTAGRASTFMELFRSQIPDVIESLTRSIRNNDLDSAFQSVRPVDFSREVLASLPQRLLVVRDAESGWADLGNPARVMDTLVRNHIEPSWLLDMPGAMGQCC